jgi:hypothetical protein
LRVVVYRGKVQALSPIAHFGDEKTGSTPVLRSVSVFNPELGKVRVPFVAGNAVRGYLRRLVMKDMLERLGYEVRSEKLYHALFAGGVLESTEEDSEIPDLVIEKLLEKRKGMPTRNAASGVLDLAFRKAVRSGIPALGLFGASIGNQMVDSCLKVGHMWPVCRETAWRLPEDLQLDPRADLRVAAFTDFVHHTRRDELRAERAEDEQPVQMLVEFEVFIPGTLFHHYFALEYASELEASCFGQALQLWAEHPWIAGKSATGYGEVAFYYEPKAPSPTLYLDYLRDQADAVKRLLDELADRLK